MKHYTELLNEFKNKTVNVKTMPACIYVESVKGCPYSCAMCSMHFTKPEQISADLLRKISPYFNDLEVLAIHGDGEPLLGDIKYFVDASIKHDFVLHMNTTGFFLTKEIADLLLKAKLSIRFSIHAGKPDTYTKIMGNKFEKVLENITYLVRKDKENNRNSDLWFSFIVMKENLGEIEEFLKITHDIGIRHVRFMELSSNAESIKGIKMPNRDFKFNYFEQYNPAVKKEFLGKLPFYRQLARELDIKIEVGTMAFSQKKDFFIQKIINKITEKMLFEAVSFPLGRRKSMCVVPWFGQLIISQDGNVRLCCSSNCSLGNINNSTLEEIWNCETMKDIRKSFKNGIVPKICRNCRIVGFDEYPRNSFVYKLIDEAARGL
jgi:radical SAM protein with 4Fe4S-binding SPASM domain